MALDFASIVKEKTPTDEEKMIKELFNEPKIVGIVGNPNEAKSNLIYYLVKQLKEDFEFNLYNFGLRKNVGGTEINSVKELEQIKNSIIFIDEFNSLFKLEDRKQRGNIENTLRIIYHNNNILVLSGLGENYKKFISAKVNVFMFKKIFYDDLINGSKAKKVIMDYQDIENIKGSHVLNLEKNQTLLFDGRGYSLMQVPYLKEFDTKSKNCAIIVQKKCKKNGKGIQTD